MNDKLIIDALKVIKLTDEHVDELHELIDRVASPDHNLVNVKIQLYECKQQYQ